MKKIIINVFIIFTAANCVFAEEIKIDFKPVNKITERHIPAIKSKSIVNMYYEEAEAQEKIQSSPYKKVDYSQQQEKKSTPMNYNSFPKSYTSVNNVMLLQDSMQTSVEQMTGY